MAQMSQLEIHHTSSSINEIHIDLFHSAILFRFMENILLILDIGQGNDTKSLLY